MAIDIEHPVVTAIRRHGYPKTQKEPLGMDDLGNTIYPGDELLVIDDYKFVKDELFYETVQVLEILGAEEKIAK